MIKRFVLQAIVLFFALFQVFPAQADVRLNYKNVDININEDTTINVREEKEYSYDGDYSIGYRLIDKDDIENIANVRVREGEVEYVESVSDSKYSFQVVDYHDYKLIKWRFRNDNEPLPNNVQKRIVIEYQIVGGIKYGDNYDYFNWKAVSDHREGPLEKIKVDVIFPQEVDMNKVSAGIESNAQNASWKIKDKRSIEFVGEDLASGESYFVKVNFPVGIVQRIVAYQRLRVPIYATFVLPALTLLVMIFLYFRFGRDYELSRIKKPLAEKPGDLTPGLAGTLVDERACVNHVAATLLDLAERGYIEITEVKDDHEFKLLKTTMNIAEYEKKLLNLLFGAPNVSGSVIRLSAFPGKVGSFMIDIEEAIYEDAVRLGYFSENPSQLRSRYGIIGCLIAVLGLGVAAFMNVPLAILMGWVIVFSGVPGFLIFDVLRKNQVILGSLLLAFIIFGAMIGVPAITARLIAMGDSMIMSLIVGITFSGAIMLIMSGSIPNKRLLGSKEKSKWLAFLKYLRAKDREKPAQYLTYAVSFGFGSEYLEMVPNQAVEAIKWYKPLEHAKLSGASGAMAALLTMIENSLAVTMDKEQKCVIK